MHSYSKKLRSASDLHFFLGIFSLSILRISISSSGFSVYLYFGSLFLPATRMIKKKRPSATRYPTRPQHFPILSPSGVFGSTSTARDVRYALSICTKRSLVAVTLARGRFHFVRVAVQDRERYTILGSRHCIQFIRVNLYTGGPGVYKSTAGGISLYGVPLRALRARGEGIARHTRHGRLIGGRFRAGSGAVRGANRAGARDEGSRSAEKTGRGRVSLRFFFELE